MKKTTVQKMTRIAFIAAIYTAVSLVLNFIAYGPIQIRIAEGLTLLPLLMPEAILGVTIGCLLTNLIGAITGANLLSYLDILIGTSATLVAALITYYFRNKKIKNIPVISIAAPIVVNAVVIGLELYFVLTPTAGMTGLLVHMFQVGLGQLIAVIIVGIPIILKLEKTLKKR